MMTARRYSNTSRPVVRFNEVVQFDDEDRGCLVVGREQEKKEIQVRMIHLSSSMEQIRWLPSLDSPETSTKNTRKKPMSPETKRMIMKDLGLSCSPMPPRLPTRWPSNHKDLEKIASKEGLPKIATTAPSNNKILSTIDRRRYLRINSA